MSVTTLNGRLVRPGFGAFAYEDDDTKERDVDFYTRVLSWRLTHRSR